MRQYLDLVRHVLETGTRKENRTGVDTISTFNFNFEHDLATGFPLLTTKAVSWKNIVVEMLWFLSGQTDISILKRHGCKFWDAWADEKTGKVPSAYGNFWRQFPVHMPPEEAPVIESGEQWYPRYNDQIAWVLNELRKNPMSRRMVVSAWAPGNAQTSKLPPCHMSFILNVQNGLTTETTLPLLEELYRSSLTGGDTPNHKAEKEAIVERLQQTEVGRRQLLRAWSTSTFITSENQARARGALAEVEEKRLCVHLTQRSCDTALGVPYNIASYALLLSIFSHLSGIKPGLFAHTLVDAHIYTAKPDGSKSEFDHIPGLKEQLTRAPKKLPTLVISDKIKELVDIEALMKPEVTTEELMSHFVLEGYEPWPAINFKVAV